MGLTRREFLRVSGTLALGAYGCRGGFFDETGVWVNDVHSELNATRVREIITPNGVSGLQEAIRRAARQGQSLCLAGGRHAMGAQQFATDAVMLDTRAFHRVLNFDRSAGLLEVEAGIQWPELMDYLDKTREEAVHPWGIAQKQTGADHLTIGGALAANVHGRGLAMKPFISDVEAFTLIDANGDIRRCSRTENAEWFRLAIGGYGLFGVIHSVQLRLAPRQKTQRIVEVIDVEQLTTAFEQRIADGFTYGDFQYAVNERTKDFLRKGIFSCYRPVDSAVSIPERQKSLSLDDWHNLFYLAHVDEDGAFEKYASHYLSTSGQIYWSDIQQMSTYPEGYHHAIDAKTGGVKATEMITEIYVPRHRLADFMLETAEDFRANGVQVFYGTVRLIERDEESFLAWAKQPYGCIIFNLHIEHTPHGLQRAGEDFRRLIDIAIKRGGSYYLTYHKHARREQVLACYPQMPEFLKAKRRLDPREVFQSDWYRHYRSMFSDLLR